MLGRRRFSQRIPEGSTTDANEWVIERVELWIIAKVEMLVRFAACVMVENDEQGEKNEDD